MARKHTDLSLELLEFIKKRGTLKYSLLSQNYKGLKRKKVYDSLYRMVRQGYIEQFEKSGDSYIRLSSSGDRLLHTKSPRKDGIWKLIIFDIPEKHRKIRNSLRGKLQQLGFKKWQNSIWVSPYEIHEEIEQELQKLSDVFFIRLIKVASINNTKDLENLFK
ncbi:MAG TPA: CRISPR-associated endonuclease Cas2 [Patescibacteria group bacterium]|nr:CRISPR-associated endonuclease Cas2 [Patescibacteria group bacterium]